jgi:transposase-like protein
MHCNRKYTPEPKRQGYSESIRKQAMEMYVNGDSLRRVAHHLQIAPQTVAYWVTKTAEALPNAYMPGKAKEAKMAVIAASAAVSASNKKTRRFEMMKKTIRIISLVVVTILVLVSSVFAYQGKTGGETAYDIPRMLGMNTGAEENIIQVKSPPTNDIQGPFVETHGNAVSMDQDLRNLPQNGPETKRPAREMGQMPAPIDNGKMADPVVQTNDSLGPLAALAVAPAPLTSFKGLDLTNWGAGWPPDTHGDVGPTHYIQAVNTSIGIFNKATGARLAAFTFNNFFIAAGGSGACTTMNYGDPIVMYDQISGRWIITDFAFAGSGTTPPYYECIAVSKTADPVSGGWWLYTVTASTTALNDYPKFGIWNDGIYMSANMFTKGATYGGVKVWALNRDDMISGAALRSVAFTLGTSYFSLLPANLKGTLAPAGTPEYFMSDYGSNTSMKLWKFTTNWTTPSSSTLTGPTSFAVASFTRPASNSIPQKGSTEKVDTLGDRLMTWLQYRNINGTESLWVSRTVKNGNKSSGIRWMEVRNMKTTASVYQQGTYAPDATYYRWMPSLAVDKFGNMAIGYSVSSSTMYPAIRYAGRLVTDALGTLGQTEQTLIAGTGSQKGGYNRWGDYSSMSVDPVNDCTFWYTTEYYETVSNNWQTRIGSFQLPGCQ